MGFNVYLGPLVQADGATSISTISLVDVDVGSFSFYIYLPTPWVKHIKTTVWRVSSLENPSCSKLYFAPSLAVAIAAALPSPVILAASRPSVSAPRNTLVRISESCARSRPSVVLRESPRCASLQARPAILLYPNKPANAMHA